MQNALLVADIYQKAQQTDFSAAGAAGNANDNGFLRSLNPFAGPSPEDQKELLKQRQQFLQFLSIVIESVALLEVSEFLMLPITNTRSETEKDPFFGFLVIEKEHSSSQFGVNVDGSVGGSYTLAIFSANTRDLCKYHFGFLTTDGVSAHANPVVVSNIPAEKMQNSLFWYSLFRPFLGAKVTEKHCGRNEFARFLYTVLCPWLNGKKLGENLAEMAATKDQGVDDVRGGVRTRSWDQQQRGPSGADEVKQQQHFLRVFRSVEMGGGTSGAGFGGAGGSGFSLLSAVELLELAAKWVVYRTKMGGGGLEQNESVPRGPFASRGPFGGLPRGHPPTVDPNVALTAASWTSVTLRTGLLKKLMSQKSAASVVTLAVEVAGKQLGSFVRDYGTDTINSHLIHELDHLTDQHARDLDQSSPGGVSSSGGPASVTRRSRPSKRATEPDQQHLVQQRNSEMAKARSFPGFEYFLEFRDNIDELKGKKRREKIRLPVPTVALPDVTKGPVVVLRKAVECLTLLSNQQDQIKQSSGLRFSLVLHLFSRILPFPVFLGATPDVHSPEVGKNFWVSAAAECYETKLELLRCLDLILKHFVTAGLQLSATSREVANARAILAGLIAAVMDVVLRTPCNEDGHLDVFGNHFSGCREQIEANGEAGEVGRDELISPFCVDFGVLEAQAGNMLIVIPELAFARSAMLTYFRCLRKEVVRRSRLRAEAMGNGEGGGRGDVEKEAARDHEADGSADGGAAPPAARGPPAANSAAPRSPLKKSGSPTRSEDLLVSPPDLVSEVSSQNSGSVSVNASPSGPDASSSPAPGTRSAAGATGAADEDTKVRSAAFEGSNHLLFAFEDKMRLSDSDASFLKQLGLSIGVNTGKNRMHCALLLSGERVDLHESFPELGYLRDAVFLVKLLLAPAKQLPVLAAAATAGTTAGGASGFRGADAALKWSYSSETLRFTVFGFRGRELSVENRALAKSLRKKIDGEIRRNDEQNFSTDENDDDMNTTGMFASFKSRALKIFGSGAQDLGPTTSFADPATISGDPDCKTEEDVLHLKKPPDFHGALNSSEDAELLLTYLTAPYIRIPLVLGFFSARERSAGLRSPELQKILDAVLFESGDWLAPDQKRSIPTQVPSTNRDFLKTSYGLLLNELLRAPEVILTAVMELLEFSHQKDSGRCTSANGVGSFFGGGTGLLEFLNVYPHFHYFVVVLCVWEWRVVDGKRWDTQMERCLPNSIKRAPWS